MARIPQWMKPFHDELKERLDNDVEEVAGLRNDVKALTQEVVLLRREIETERRLRLSMKR